MRARLVHWSLGAGIVIVGAVLLAHSGGWTAFIAPALLISPLVNSFQGIGSCAVNGVEMWFRPIFAVGDVITVEGLTGEVESIGIIRTWLTDSAGRRIPVPNTKFQIDVIVIEQKGIVTP